MNEIYQTLTEDDYQNVIIKMREAGCTEENIKRSFEIWGICLENWTTIRGGD